MESKRLNSSLHTGNSTHSTQMIQQSQVPNHHHADQLISNQYNFNGQSNLVNQVPTQQSQNSSHNSLSTAGSDVTNHFTRNLSSLHSTSSFTLDVDSELPLPSFQELFGYLHNQNINGEHIHPIKYRSTKKKRSLSIPAHTQSQQGRLSEHSFRTDVGHESNHLSSDGVSPGGGTGGGEMKNVEAREGSYGNSGGGVDDGMGYEVEEEAMSIQRLGIGLEAVGQGGISDESTGLIILTYVANRPWHKHSLGS